jgi:hypothetical protein
MANLNGPNTALKTSEKASGAPSSKHDDDMELPTVDVAGSNFTANCLDLATTGKKEATQAVYCTVETKIEQEFLLTADFRIKRKPQDEGYPPVAVSGKSGHESSGWFVSAASNLQMQFEIPVAELAAMRKQSAQLTMENATANKKAVGKTPVLSIKISDYFMPNSGCSSEALEQVVSLQFKEVKKDSTGVIYRSQLAATADVVVPPNSTFCEAEFLNDLTLNWPVQSKPQQRRLSGIIGGRSGVFTNIKPLEKAFRLSAASFLWQQSGNASTLISMNSVKQEELGAAVNWCAFGRADCLSQVENLSNRAVTETIHLTRVAPLLLSANAQTLFSPADQSGGFEIRTFNYPEDSSQIAPVLQDDGKVKLRVRYLPPAETGPATVQAEPPEKEFDCNSIDKLKTDAVTIVIPKNNPAYEAQRCPFGIGDNNIRRTGDGYHTARLDRKFNISIPSGRTVCSMKAAGQNQNIVYDDHIILALNSNIIFATGQQSSLNFQKAGNGFYLYDWSKLKGKRFGNQTHCADGATCQVPSSETSGVLAFELSDEANSRLFNSLQGKPLYFSLTIIGDNDLHNDCLQSEDLTLTVNYSYFTKSPAP